MINELIADSAARLTLEESPTWQGGKLTDDEGAEAADLIRQTPDRTRFHLLMALRRDRPERYGQVPAAVRAAVLTEAMIHVRWLNDFGYLDPGGSWDGPAATALVETGSPAQAPLRQLLTDRSSAPLHGSETATLAHLYGYRRCDFAYRYLAMISGQDPAFDPSPERRDEQIAELFGRS